VVSISDDEGVVHGEFIAHGERTGVDEEGDKWMLTDGQWWREGVGWKS
jgi:hypothetical protein